MRSTGLVHWSQDLCSWGLTEIAGFIRLMILKVFDPRTRAGTVCALADMANVMACNGWVMSDADARRFQFAALAFQCGYMKMAVSALGKRQLRWKIRPKWHQLICHLVPMVPLNGRYFMNYLDEDYVRRTKHLASRCTPSGMSSEVCQRFCLQACMRWAELYAGGLTL